MAEFLIMLNDPGAETPDELKQFRYYRGDIVVVKPDNWSWGSEEKPPKFGLIKVPGMTVEEAQQWLVSEDEIVSLKNPNTDQMEQHSRMKRRRKFIAPIPNKWTGTTVTITGPNFRNQIRQKP